MKGILKGNITLFEGKYKSIRREYHDISLACIYHTTKTSTGFMMNYNHETIYIVPPQALKQTLLPIGFMMNYNHETNITAHRLHD